MAAERHCVDAFLIHGADPLVGDARDRTDAAEVRLRQV